MGRGGGEGGVSGGAISLSVPELLMVKQLLPKEKTFLKYIAVPKEENGPSLIGVLFFL